MRQGAEPEGYEARRTNEPIDRGSAAGWAAGCEPVGLIIGLILAAGCVLRACRARGVSGGRVHRPSG